MPIEGKENFAQIFYIGPIYEVKICNNTCMRDSMALSLATAMVMPRGLKLACTHNQFK